jgi:hypothetical protein
MPERICGWSRYRDPATWLRLHRRSAATWHDRRTASISGRKYPEEIAAPLGHGPRFLLADPDSFWRDRYPSVSGSQIAVQSQRLFAFSAALSCTVRCNLDQAQHGVGERVVRSHRERPGHKRLGRRKASRTVIAGVGGAYRCIHECDAAIKDLAFKRREAGRAFQRAGKRKVVIGIRKSAEK